MEELQQAHLDLISPPASIDMVADCQALVTSVRTCIQAALLDATRGAPDFKLIAKVFDDLDSEISKALDREISRDRLDDRKSWKLWVKETMSKGVGWAHRWSSRLTSWQPTRVWSLEKARWSGRPIDLLEAEQKRLSNLWHAVPQEPVLLQADLRGEDLAAISPEQLRAASRCFSKATARTWDGLHPRHFSLLEDAHLDLVGRLLRAIERVGAFPSQIRAIVTVLIEKHKPGPSPGPSYRGIGMMPGLWRVWGKHRQLEFRAWEVKHHRRYLAHQAGKGVLEVVFEQALKAEGNFLGDTKVFSAAVLWDLSNYYEYIDRQLWRDRAKETNFSDSLVVVISNQYQAPRIVATRSSALPAGCPLRGIAAGCWAATFVVQQYCLPPIDIWVAQNPRVRPTIFIDDFMLDSHNRQPNKLIADLATASASMHQAITVDLKCDIAKHKAAVVACNPRIQADLSDKLGQWAGPTDNRSQPAAANLGVDFTSGARLRSKARRTLKARAVKLKSRLRRLRALRAAGADTKKIWNTGLQQAGYFGAEILGLTDQEFQEARSLFLSVAGPKCATRSRSLSLAILEDPTWRSAMGPCIYWSTIVFRASQDPRKSEFTLPELRHLAEGFGN